MSKHFRDKSHFKIIKFTLPLQNMERDSAENKKLWTSWRYEHWEDDIPATNNTSFCLCARDAPKSVLQFENLNQVQTQATLFWFDRLCFETPFGRFCSWGSPQLAWDIYAKSTIIRQQKIYKFTTPTIMHLTKFTQLYGAHANHTTQRSSRNSTYSKEMTQHNAAHTTCWNISTSPCAHVCHVHFFPFLASIWNTKWWK